MLFANQLKEEDMSLENNTTMKQFELNMKLLEKNVKSLKTNFIDRKSTRLNSSHSAKSRMPSSA